MKVWVWNSPGGVVAFRKRLAAQGYVEAHFGGQLWWERRDDSIEGEYYGNSGTTLVTIDRVEVQP